MDDAATIGDAQRRIVDHLKRVDGATTGAIAAAMGVTTQAVRPQLAALEAQGLVVSEALSTGSRGRPPIEWRLSTLAIELFPDRHADLTVELIDAIRAALGDDGLEQVLATRDASHLAALRAEMEPGAGVAARLEVLAEARTRQGYMAEVVEEDGDLLLVEHHCPVCAAATACQGLCRNELALFRDALGDDVEVERTAHLLSGDERCVYRVRRRAAG